MIDVYFADITANNNKDLVAKGGFAINCDHAGEHCANPPELTAAMWQLLKDHTFATTTSPYVAGLPASFPAYCTIVQRPSSRAHEALLRDAIGIRTPPLRAVERSYRRSLLDRYDRRADSKRRRSAVRPTRGRGVRRLAAHVGRSRE